MNAESHPTDGTRPAGVTDGGSVDHTQPVRVPGFGAAELSVVTGVFDKGGRRFAEVTADTNTPAVSPEPEFYASVVTVGASEEEARQAAIEAWNLAFGSPEVSSLTAERDRLREERDRLEGLYHKAARMCDISAEMLAMASGSSTGIVLDDGDLEGFEVLRAKGHQLATELQALDPHLTAADLTPALSTTPAPDAPAEDAETPRVERDSPETDGAA